MTTSKVKERTLVGGPTGGVVSRPAEQHWLGFDVSVRQSEHDIRFACHFRNHSNQAVYLQNQYGPSRKLNMGYVGGGRHPDQRLGKGLHFSSYSACLWPSDDGSLMVFQGEVSDEGAPACEGSTQPAYSRLTDGEVVCVIALPLPLRQWENNLASAGEGESILVDRIHICVEVLLAPLAVEEAHGVWACDYGQPGYVESVVGLERPIAFVRDPSSPNRAAAKLRALRTLACVGERVAASRGRH